MVILGVLWMAIILHFEFMGHIRLGIDKNEVHGFLRIVIATIISTVITLIVGLTGFIILSIV